MKCQVRQTQIKCDHCTDGNRAIHVGLPSKLHAVPLHDDHLVVYTEQNVNNQSGFLKIPCSFAFSDRSKGRSVDVEWFNPSGMVVEVVSHKRVARILRGSAGSKCRCLFAARKQGEQSVHLYIRGDRLVKYQGNYTCKASSMYYDSDTILREIQVMKEHG